MIRTICVTSFLPSGAPLAVAVVQSQPCWKVCDTHWSTCPSSFCAFSFVATWP